MEARSSATRIASRRCCASPPRPSAAGSARGSIRPRGCATRRGSTPTARRGGEPGQAHQIHALDRVERRPARGGRRAADRHRLAPPGSRGRRRPAPCDVRRPSRDRCTRPRPRRSLAVSPWRDRARVPAGRTCRRRRSGCRSRARRHGATVAGAPPRHSHGTHDRRGAAYPGALWPRARVLDAVARTTPAAGPDRSAYALSISPVELVVATHLARVGPLVDLAGDAPALESCARDLEILAERLDPFSASG